MPPLTVPVGTGTLDDVTTFATSTLDDTATSPPDPEAGTFLETVLDAVRHPVPVSATDDDDFRATVARLSAQSLVKRYDAYEDIPWDDPEFQIEDNDPRMRLWAVDPIGATDWYQSLPEERRFEVARHRVASNMRIGLEFENMLQRGLLDFALRLPQGAPEFRYVLHEVIEETHHTMMFQEFANRAGVQAGTMPRSLQMLCQKAVLPLAWAFPELFFVFVLGGEEPIDHIQRSSLKEAEHPLVEMVMRIHVTEEARHIGFAKSFLAKRVPALGPIRRRILGSVTPVVLAVMVPLMVQPSSRTVREVGIPRDVVREIRTSDKTRQLNKDSVRKIRKQFGDLGLIDGLNRRIWKAVGLWDDQ